MKRIDCVRPPRTNRVAAFTVLEVMVACTVLIIGIVGLMSILAYATAQEMTNLQHTNALNGARARMERIKNTPFGGLAAWNTVIAMPHGCNEVGMHNCFDVEGLTPELGPSGSSRYIYGTSTPAGLIVVDLADPDLAEVTVSVTWLDPMGRAVTIQLQTKIAEY